MRSLILSSVLFSLALLLGPTASNADAQIIRRTVVRQTPYYYGYPQSTYYGGYYYPQYSSYYNSYYGGDYYPPTYNYNSYYYPSQGYYYPSNNQYYVYPGIIYRY